MNRNYFKGEYQLKKLIKNKRILVPVLILIGLIFFATIVNAALSDPGTVGDPLVTLSYVEQRITETREYIGEIVDVLLPSINNNSTKIDDISQENIELKAQIEELKGKVAGTGQSLEVIHLTKGKILTCNAGTEIILRSGKAKAVGSDLGGLSDITGAVDIQTGGDIPLNHLLIVPRSDGRGAVIIEDAYIMIRGEYEVN